MASTPERFGPYFVYEQLGVGGMATVHVAESRGPGGFRKPLALKRLPEHGAANRIAGSALSDQAQRAQDPPHPNLTRA